MKTNPVPEGCHSINSYIHVKETARFVDFVKRAFDAVEHVKLLGPDGKIQHAQMRIGDSIVMLSEPHPPFQAGSALLYHYVADVDAIYQQALAAGAESLYAPMNMFFGDRLACVKDFAGNYWTLATRIENITPEEVQKRINSFSQRAAQAKG